MDVEVQDMGFGREAVWLLRKCVGLEVRQTWNGSCSSLHGFRHFVLLFVKTVFAGYRIFALLFFSHTVLQN